MLTKEMNFSVTRFLVEAKKRQHEKGRAKRQHEKGRATLSI